MITSEMVTASQASHTLCLRELEPVSVVVVSVHALLWSSVALKDSRTGSMPSGLEFITTDGVEGSKVAWEAIFDEGMRWPWAPHFSTSMQWCRRPMPRDRRSSGANKRNSSSLVVLSRHSLCN